CNTAGTVGNDTSIIDFYQTQLPNVKILSAKIVSAGQDMETDSQLRTRWKKSLAGAGISTYDSIIGGILRISGIQDCVIFENDTDKNIDDGSGFMIPPHSFETVVSGGMDASAEIAQVIFDKKPIGIGTAGANAYTVEDAAGILHTICFSYAETVSSKVVMTIQTGYVLPESYVHDIAESVASYFTSNQMGQTIYPVSVCAAVMNTGLAETVTELAFSQSGGLQTPLTISAKQIAVCELKDVYIRSSDGDSYYHVIGDGTLENVADPWEVQS
ncbi:MAG: baseplate J/gp47 family protein, partial [Ruminococcus sp.]|nr:baseplate J/gp47 family protein [Ruminococcus sp.]